MSTPAALACAVLASLWFVSAIADRPSERGAIQPCVSRCDLDRDGFIDRREYYQFRQRLHPRPGAHHASTAGCMRSLTSIACRRTHQSR